MVQEYLWHNSDPSGWEHVRLIDDHPGWDVFDSVLVRADGDQVRRGGYTLVVDKQWRSLEIRCLIEVEPGVMGSVHILSEGDGIWYDENEQRLTALDGCLDIAIEGSRLTPTLPVQRLGLRNGQAAELRIVEISLTGLSIQPIICQLKRDGDTLQYQRDDTWEELQLDTDGFVVHGPGQCERTFPR